MSDLLTVAGYLVVIAVFALAAGLFEGIIVWREARRKRLELDADIDGHIRRSL